MKKDGKGVVLFHKILDETPQSIFLLSRMADVVYYAGHLFSYLYTLRNVVA